jgi:hypothetical protein
VTDKLPLSREASLPVWPTRELFCPDRAAGSMSVLRPVILFAHVTPLEWCRPDTI